MYIEEDKNAAYYKEARKIVEKKKKFHNQLASCIGTSLFLFGINIFIGSRFLWSVFPIMAMALSMFIKGFKLYGPFWKDANWESRSMEREIERLKRMDPSYRESEVYYQKRNLNPTNTGSDELNLSEEKAKAEKTWKDSDFV